MLKIISIKDIAKTIDEGYKVYIIVRALGKAKSLVDDKSVFYLPDLSPSFRLLNMKRAWDQCGAWNQDAFIEGFAPEYMLELQGKQQKTAMNKIWHDAIEGNVALACFCPDETLCHRSLLLGIFQAYEGFPAERSAERNYSPYFLMYAQARKGQLKFSDYHDSLLKVRPAPSEKPITLF